MAFRKLVAALQEENGGDDPNKIKHIANFAESSARRQRKTMKSTFGAELNGLVDDI